MQPHTGPMTLAFLSKLLRCALLQMSLKGDQELSGIRCIECRSMGEFDFILPTEDKKGKSAFPFCRVLAPHFLLLMCGFLRTFLAISVIFTCALFMSVVCMDVCSFWTIFGTDWGLIDRQMTEEENGIVTRSSARAIALPQRFAKWHHTKCSTSRWKLF